MCTIVAIMSERSDAPIALAGWIPGTRWLFPAVSAARLRLAATVLVEGDAVDRPFDGRGVSAPEDPRTAAEELVRLAAEGLGPVWATEGDPLEDAAGRRIAEWLTALGESWEYLPCLPSGLERRPGAVAHLSRSSVAADDEAWRAWRAAFPLLGVTVAVTRAAAQAGALANALAAEGADAVVAPTIEIADPEDTAPLDRALGDLGRYGWAIFTSANGVERFFARLAATDGDVRDLAGVRIAAIGPATAAAIRECGIRVDLVPEAYVAEELFAALDAAGPVEGESILIPRAAVARDVLPDALREAGAEVDVVETYRTVRPEASRELLAMLVETGRADLVTFTSSSTVTNFVALVGSETARRARAACIGPITAETARRHGIDVAVEAAEFTVDGLVAAIRAWAARAAPTGGSR